MTRTGYIEDSKDYLSDESLHVLSEITDTEFEALVKVTEELTGTDEPGIECSLVLTRETVSDWRDASKSWRELRGVEESENHIVFRRVQMHKGQQRVDVAVMARQDGAVVLTF